MPACVFVLFDRDSESDFRCLVMIPYLGNQTQYQNCLSGTLSLVAFPMSVSNCASDNTLTGSRIDFSVSKQEVTFQEQQGEVSTTRLS